jgi:hypothetical protein
MTHTIAAVLLGLDLCWLARIVRSIDLEHA